jgi:hypothetical protein
MAMSPTSHIVVAASQNPPLVLVKYRQGSWEQLTPIVSKTSVSVISFHPKKSNLFLLGFKDGSVGLYDANAIVRKGQAKEKASPAKEISSFPKLHNEVRSDEGDSCGITGASFLPGTRLTAVTIGLDGKCKVIDFETKSIKTWSVKAPAASLAVLPMDEKGVSQRKPEPMRSKASTASAKSVVSGPIIAVGRIDGQLRLYNRDGDLLLEKTADEMNGSVTDLEWIPGKSPQAVGNWTTVDIEKHPLIDLSVSSHIAKRVSVDQSTKSPGVAQAVPSVQSSEEVISTYSLPPPQSEDSNDMTSLDASATVRHTDIKGVGLQFPTYMDLFSPIKIQPEGPVRTTSPRSRPRITSATFAEHISAPASPEASKAAISVINPAERQEPIPSPRILPTQASPPKLIVKNLKRKASPKKVAFKSFQNSGSIFNIPAGLLASQDGRLVIEEPSSQSSSNSEILARIRALGSEKQTGSRKVRGNLAALAPYYHSQNSLVERKVSNNIEFASVNNRKGSSSSIVSRRPRRSIGNAGIHGRVVKIKPRPRVERSVEAEIWFTESETESPKQPPKCGHNSTKRPNDSVAATSDFPQDSTTGSMYTATSQSFAEIPSSLYYRSSSSEKSRRLRAIQDAGFGSGPQLHASMKYFAAKADSDDGTSELTISTRKQSHSTSTSSQVLPTPISPRFLPPGFAESYQGPVSMEHYLPRQASLNFGTPERRRSEGRAVLGTLSGNEQRSGEADLGQDECGGCYALRVRVEKLEQELSELRMFVIARQNKDQRE